MRPLALTLLLALSTHATDYPLWDNQEPIANYAQRVNLPPTKTLDLGNNVTLDLVLIPAGQFEMGEPQPEPPTITIAGSIALIWTGAITSAILLLYLAINCLRRRRRFNFSLRWIMLMVIFTCMFFGGLARKPLAESAWQQYQSDLENYEISYAKPAHLVTITRPFYIGKYSITQSQYQAVMRNNPSFFNGPQLPVEKVSWDDAIAFCKKISPQCQLPTEAQWEYACRAGTKTNYYSGSDDRSLDSVAWYVQNSNNTTHLVGQKKPNVFGLYDMHGNVWQWCADYWNGDSYAFSTKNDPTGPNEGLLRVLRGGSGGNKPNYCRSAYRSGNSPDNRNSIFGFRIVVPVE